MYFLVIMAFGFEFSLTSKWNINYCISYEDSSSIVNESFNDNFFSSSFLFKNNNEAAEYNETM